MRMLDFCHKLSTKTFWGVAVLRHLSEKVRVRKCHLGVMIYV